MANSRTLASTMTMMMVMRTTMMGYPCPYGDNARGVIHPVVFQIACAPAATTTIPSGAYHAPLAILHPWSEALDALSLAEVTASLNK